MNQLYELREWLTDRIDGSEETRGEDSLISHFINQIDAMDDQVRRLTQPKTIAEWQAAKAPPSATATTVDHGYDRTASLAEGRYVCTCGGACSRPDASRPSPTTKEQP